MSIYEDGASQDISLFQVIKIINRNITSILFLFICLSLIGISLTLKFITIYQPSEVSRISLNIDDEILESASHNYFFSKKNFLLAASKSGIDKEIITDQFISSFSIIPGEINSNIFITYLNNQNFDSLAKKIAIDKNFLSSYFEEINNYSKTYKTLLINRDAIRLSEDMLDIFISNLITATNEKIVSDFNLAKVKIGNLSYNNESQDDRIKILYIREYINTLKKYLLDLEPFTSFAPSINLDELTNEVFLLESEFRNYLNRNEGIVSYIMKKNNIRIQSLDLQINSIKDIINNLEKFSIQDQGIAENENSVESLSYDSDSLTKILEIGSALSNNEAKVKYTDLLYDKLMQKFQLIEENESYTLKPDDEYIITIDSLDIVASEIANEINNFVEITKDLSDYYEPIKMISNRSTVKSSTFNQLKSSLLLIFISSLLISVIIPMLREYINHSKN